MHVDHSGMSGWGPRLFVFNKSSGVAGAVGPYPHCKLLGSKVPNGRHLAMTTFIIMHCSLGH